MFKVLEFVAVEVVLVKSSVLQSGCRPVGMVCPSHPPTGNYFLKRFFFPNEKIIQNQTKIHQTSPKFTQIHQNSPKCTKIHSDSPKFTQMHPNAPKCTKIHQNSPEFTQIQQNSPKFTRFCNVVKFGSKWMMSPTY